MQMAHEMSGLELEASISDEVSQERLEQFSKLWYQAEALVCRSCKYAKICGWRRFPCIVVAAREGKWNRSLLRETYPKDTEAIEQISKKDWNASAAFGGLIRWYSKEAAEILGFKSLVLRMQVHSSTVQYKPVNFRPDVSFAQWKTK